MAFNITCHLFISGLASKLQQNKLLIDIALVNFINLLFFKIHAMKKLLLIAILLPTFLFAQRGNYWTFTANNNYPAQEKMDRRSVPTDYSLLSLDLAGMQNALKNAPSRHDYAVKKGIIMSFPDAEGNLQEFRVYNAPVMEPGLAAKFPDFHSYIGIGIDDPTARLRFSMTLFGLHTMAFYGNEETVYIDPYTKDHKTYIVYNRSSLPNPGNFSCDTANPTDEGQGLLFSANSTQLSDGTYRTYRLALSTTIEYSAYHINAAGLNSGTNAQKLAAVMAAIVVSVTRVNQIYETDLAVHLSLIDNNDQLINITSDTFTNDNGNTLLNENQAFIDGVIGTDGYDIGHVFSTGGGGIAQLGSVCNSSGKARGVTGAPSPVGDNFDVDYVAHEMGHQFGGTHTFNGIGTNCTTSTRTNSTAVEPGSGSTIMAYAGICSPVNVQNHSDPHFSYASIAQVNTLVNNSATCSVNIANGNAAPVVGPLKNYTIPFGTAFQLRGSATDADNATGLSYCWEQRDNQISTQPPDPQSTTGPNFRSRPPVAVPTRYMPALTSIFANNLAPAYEMIPTVARTMNFALTVRDNASPNGGQTGRSDMVLTYANTGPFVITNFTTAQTLQLGTNQTITWDVAGTTANGVNTPYVDIYSGTTTAGFDTLLASKVPNDGSEVITVLGPVRASNRFMVKGNGNIFLDVSNASLSVANPTTSSFGLSFDGTADGQNKKICPGTNTSYTLNYTTYAGFNAQTNFTVTGAPSGSTVSITPSATATSAITLSVSNTAALPVGFYTLTVTGTSGALSKTVNLYLEVINPVFTASVLTTPANGATNQPQNTSLNWVFDTVNATSYVVQVATDSAFNNIVNTATVTTSTYTTPALQGSTTYYWRIAPKNGECQGPYSAVYSFTTQFLMGLEDHSGFAFSVYPNPSNGSFVIQSDTIYSDKGHITVYDMRGRLIYDRAFKAAGSIRENVDLQAQAGIYLLSVSDGTNKEVKRIVIK